MKSIGDSGAYSTQNFNLHSGRIVLLLAPIILLILQWFYPETTVRTLLSEINTLVICLYSFLVLGSSYKILWVRQHIYFLVVGLFLMMGVYFLYNIYLNQFGTRPLIALIVFILLTPWYLNYKTHLLVYQAGFLILLVLVCFVTPSPIIDPFGYLLRYILINISLFFLIGSRINTIRTLIDRESYFYGLFEKLNEGILQIDQKGNIIECNQKLAEILGYTQEELKNDLKIEDVIPEDDQAVLKKQFSERKTGKSGRYEIRMIRKDKSVIWTQVSATSNRDKDGLFIGSMAVIIDITDKKAAALELDNYAQVLAQTNKELSTKNSELEQFADIASSDLRIPLQEIRHSAKILVDLIGPKDPLSAEYAEEIIGKVNNMQNLLNAILVYTDSSEGKMNMTRVNLKPLLDDIAENMQQILKNNRTKLHYSELPTLLVDRIQMQRLFRNLIANSINYRGAHTLDINISYSVNPETREYIFSIEDNGAGIKREDYDKIFTIFRKDHNLNENSVGMGLAVSKKIAANHGGRLWFTSNVGKGTTFFLSLPIPRTNNEIVDTETESEQTGSESVL